MGEKPLEIRKIGQAEAAVRGPRAHFVEQGMRGVDGVRIAQREKAETDPAAGLGYTQAGKMLQHLAEFQEPLSYGYPCKLTSSRRGVPRGGLAQARP